MKVLVVEDDDGMREPVEDALCTLGFEFDWARSQEEAREMLCKHRYDLALVDLEIPVRIGRGFAQVEHGRRAIEEIHGRGGPGRIPVVVMTGHGKEGLDLV